MLESIWEDPSLEEKFFMQRVFIHCVALEVESIVETRETVDIETEWGEFQYSTRRTWHVIGDSSYAILSINGWDKRGERSIKWFTSFANTLGE